MFLTLLLAAAAAPPPAPTQCSATTDVWVHPAAYTKDGQTPARTEPASGPWPETVVHVDATTVWMDAFARCADAARCAGASETSLSRTSRDGAPAVLAARLSARRDVANALHARGGTPFDASIAIVFHGPLDAELESQVVYQAGKAGYSRFRRVLCGGA